MARPLTHCPLGAPLTVRFAFLPPGVELTDEQQQALKDGNGIPPGLGIDQQVVHVQVSEFAQPEQTLTAASDGNGTYHATFTPQSVGLLRWKGRGYDNAGNPTAATALQSVMVDP